MVGILKCKLPYYSHILIQSPHTVENQSQNPFSTEITVKISTALRDVKLQDPLEIFMRLLEKKKLPNKKSRP